MGKYLKFFIVGIFFGIVLVKSEAVSWYRIFEMFKFYIIGGIIFGLGWALCGACPGPMYILIGTGAFSILIVIAAALLGTYIYGVFKNKLPH